VTEGPARAKADAIEVVREMIRRAGHEIRNALNGVAVNVEVVRSRATRPDGEGGSGKHAANEIASFAERAGSQIGEASALTDGLLALVGNVLAAEAEGTLRSQPGAGGGSRIELMIYGDRATALVSDIKRLTERIGVKVEQGPRRVILTILPEGRSHFKA
jgi:signal transduction histidine kinase